MNEITRTFPFEMYTDDCIDKCVIWDYKKDTTYELQCSRRMNTYTLSIKIENSHTLVLRYYTFADEERCFIKLCTERKRIHYAIYNGEGYAI